MPFLSLLRERLLRRTTAPAPTGETASVAADEPPAESPPPAGEALPDSPPPGDEASRAHGFLRSRTLWLAVGGIALAGAGALASALVMQGRNAQALHELQARQAALERENQALRNLPRIIAAPQVAPAAQVSPPGRATPEGANPVPSTPTAGPAPAVRAPVSGECVVATDDDLHATVRDCIERFNRASARAQRLPPR